MEEDKCKVYHHRYHRDPLCGGDGPVNVRNEIYFNSSSLLEKESCDGDLVSGRERFLLCPSAGDGAELSASHSKQSLPANTCSCPETPDTHHITPAGLKGNLFDTLTLLLLLLTSAEP